MIESKIVRLANIGFERGDEEWQRVGATLSLDEESDEDLPELEIEIEGIKIAIPVEDIFECLAYLGIDVQAWSVKHE